MTPGAKIRAQLRLLAVQGAWNYERMLGTGMGYAAEPLLADLTESDPVRHTEAVVRSAEFFNCNPMLAGLALGATVRAEYDAAPGAQVARLRTALCSPLGALGDQFFWAGLLPMLVAAALIAVVLGAGFWAVLGLLIAYGAVRLWTGAWALRTGLAAGLRVGQAINASWLPNGVRRVGPVAGFAVGLAVPLAAGWYLRDFSRHAAAAVIALAVAIVVAVRWLQPAVTAVRFTLAAVGLTLLLRWVVA